MVIERHLGHASLGEDRVDAHRTQSVAVKYKGNRLMLSTGNLSKSDNVSLFLVDYPQRSRLKILGHARVVDAREHPELVEQFAEVADRRLVESVYLIDVVSFDWNCPKYITPHYTAAEVAQAVFPPRARIAELEAQLKTQPKS